MKTVAFFNNKGGVGKTTLLYHLAWMYADLGLRVVAVDLDPQSNLTSSFLDEDRLTELWTENVGQTVVSALSPLLEDGTGEVHMPHLEKIARNLAIVPGDLGLARLEDELGSQWSRCLDGVAKAFRITTSLHQVAQLAGQSFEADLILLDVGPNLAALNRCALIAAEHVAVPLVPDLYSLQGLRNLGPTLVRWRKDWQKRLAEAPATVGPMPAGRMHPAGYIVLQHAVRQSRPVKAYLRWAQRIPAEYRDAMQLEPAPSSLTIESDEMCLAQLKHYRSLMPMAMEAGKPIFRLKPVDGAIGAHVVAVADARDDFEKLAKRLAISVGLPSTTNSLETSVFGAANAVI